MPDDLSTPRVLRTAHGTQYSYELPHRIHNAAVYPITSVNGSTVILYGHEHGVKIVWRGGRSLRPASTRRTAPGKTNGAESAVISLDSDEEDGSANKYDDKPEFEDEELDDDSTGSCPRIIQTLDLNLGAAALNISVLPAAMTRTNQPLPNAFNNVRDKLTFVAACSDNYLRLVTLPLSPPSHESKARFDFRKHPYNTVVGNGSWGEKITKLSGHQRPADGLSMTLDIATHSRNVASQEATSPTSDHGSIIVASHSKEITGLLLLFRVPLKAAAEQVEPFQTVYLPSPATTVSFNTSTSLPRTAHLLVAEVSGACRVYDYSSLSRVAEPQTGVAAEQGTWLLSLYPGFSSHAKDTNAFSGFGRKIIVDARWVSGGRAIVALLDDGEWIVWDVEGAGPAASQGFLGRQGVTGGSNTAYALSGYIESSSKFRAGPSQSTTSKFAPMTPGTRKSVDPFGTSRSHVSSTGGQLSVIELPSNSATSNPDDSVAFWFGETFAIIPSLNKYWASHRTGTANPFVGSGGARIIKVDGIDLQGERCSGIVQIAAPSGSFPELLILGEHRFTISTSSRTQKSSSRVAERLALTEGSAVGGELEDIDRALSMMDRDSRMELF